MYNIHHINKQSQIDKKNCQRQCYEKFVKSQNIAFF